MVGGTIIMIKEDIRKIIEDCNSEIKINLGAIKQIKGIDYYTDEYKKAKIEPYKKKISKLKIEAKNKIENIFNSEIDKIKSKEVFNFGDLETSNILKMLEMSISSMHRDEIQYLVDKYSDNPVIYRTLQSQIKSHNIMGIEMPIKIFLPNTKELEEKRETICNGANIDNDSLFGNLSTEMIMANDETQF